ncbi:hypothetical protein [uncultured Acetobacteroides sp.]|uniref:hypothetical protein n=1 Tax=uncultured Acetobacteroides sp. TaxID=1760811 RepID=UPI0029F4EBAA|nr:hypothetical protein [uncultured Acetobacteroides sp.]
MTKLKIRKIESTPEEIISRIDKIIEISEQIPNRVYLGTSLKEIWSTLGIKELEFGELRFENKELFDELFEIHTTQYSDATKTIFRRSFLSKIK